MTKITLALTSCTIFFMGCMVVSPPPIYRKNGLTYGDINDYTYIEDWDSCYRRGISYGRGGYWEDAVYQFLKAIRERPKDQWRARTFGMNVLDEYFPHRELGIVYLHQGRIKEAIEELSLSLTMTDSGKAKYYLNKAHRQWLQEGGWDETPPVIHLLPESAGAREVFFTNTSLYQLEGRIEDDFFVASIVINGTPLFNELAQPTIFFQEKTALSLGMNTITCEASDLIGHKAIRDLKVYLDIQGPLVLVGPGFNPELPGLSGAAASGKKLKGMVLDDGGLNRLVIGEEEIPLQPGEKIWTFEFDLSARNRDLTFQATDLAGNTTRGDLSWLLQGGKNGVFSTSDNRNSSPIQKGLIQVCDNSTYLPLPEVRLAGHRRREEGLTLKIMDCPEVVFNSKIVIQGLVTSLTEIAEVRINKSSVFSRQHPAGLIESMRRVWDNLWKDGNIAFYFTYLYEGLEEGRNRITIRAQDKDGRSVQKEITVEYRFREIDKIGNRWQLALLPFDKYEKDKPLLVFSALETLNYLDDLLWYCFDQSKRFLMVERESLVPIMREKRLQSYYSQMKKKDFARMGETLAAEVFLSGAMRVDWDGPERLMEITGRLIDGETGEVLDTQNVYNQWRTKQDEDCLLNGLVHKFIEEFPLARGRVSGKNHEELTIDLGSDDFIKKGMKIIVFRQTDSDKEYTEKKQKILGEAKLTRIYENSSLASPSTGALLEKTDVGDSVITK